MDGHGATTGLRHRPGLVGFFLLAVLAYAPAQAVPRLVLDPPTIGDGDTLTVSFIVSVRNPQDLRVDHPDRIPDNLRLLEGPNLRPISRETGAVQVVFVFRAVKPGRRILPPFDYSVRGRRQATGGAVIGVGVRGKPNEIPFEAGWRLDQAEVYEGQSFPAVVAIRNALDIVVADSVNLGPAVGAEIQAASGLGAIQTEAEGEAVLFNVPVASYLVTPSRAGRLLLPAARVRVGEARVDAPQAQVQVRRLPVGVEATGAVGSFFYSSWLESADVPLGRPALLHVRVEGEGNLTYLRISEPSGEGILVSDRAVTRNLQPGGRGYRGSVEWTFRLTAPTSGLYSVKVPDFVWLEPESGRLVTAAGKSVDLRVAEPMLSREAVTDDLPLISSTEARRHRPADLYRKPIMLLLALPGPIALVTSALLRRRPFKILPFLILLMAAGEAGDDAAFDLMKTTFETGRYQQSLEAAASALSAKPGDPPAHFNLGLIHHRLGQRGLSVYHLRRAVEGNPMDERLHQALLRVESEYGLSQQIPAPRMHPDFFLIVMLSTWNLAGIAVAGLLRRRRAGLVILSVTAGLGFLISTGMLALNLSAGGKEVGIVAHAAGDLKRIPRRDAKEWYLLEEGTALHVLGSSGEFNLVETAYGVEGWIRRDGLVKWP